MRLVRILSFRPAMMSILASALLLTPVGCTSTAPQLKLTSVEHQQTFRQEFTRGYSRRDSTGNIDVVLLDAAGHEAMASGRTAGSVRQVMHIRVLWTPSREMKAVATNASIKWYVIHDASPQEVLAYGGSGFVSFDDEKDGSATLTIRNAMLKPTESHGRLADPVGISRLEGSVVARADEAQVRKILTDLNISLDAATAADTARAAADAVRDKGDH